MIAVARSLCRWDRRASRPGSRPEHRPRMAGHQPGPRADARAADRRAVRTRQRRQPNDAPRADRVARTRSEAQPGDRPGRTGGWPAEPTPPAGAWRDIPASWVASRGQYSDARLDPAVRSVLTVRSAPTGATRHGWFVASVPRGGHLVTRNAPASDADGFARLRQPCERDPHTPRGAGTRLHRAAVILGAKGGLLRQITVGDVIELAGRRGQRRTPSQMGHGPGFTGFSTRWQSSRPRHRRRCGS